MHLTSEDFRRQTPEPAAPAQTPRFQRGRAIFGTILFGIIALVLIAIVLTIVSSLGERRLALLQKPTSAAVWPAPRSNRPTPGLQVPAPLAEHPLRQQGPLTPDAMIPAEMAPPIVAVSPPPELRGAPSAEAPVPPRPLTIRQIQQMVAGLPFPRIHDAFLWRPYADPTPQPAQHPAVTGNLLELRRASRFSPDALGAIAEAHRPQPTLAQLRAQAVISRRLAATTQPSS